MKLRGLKITFALLVMGTSGVTQDFNSGLVGKIMPGKIIFGDGIARDVAIKYQMPESFKNPQNKFTLAIGSGEPYTHSGGIEAFQIDNLTWALRTVPVATDGYAPNTTQFVILKRQGAIEEYDYVIYGKPDDKENMLYASTTGSRTKTIFRKTGTNEFVEGVLTDEKLKQWISDSPAALEDLNNAEVQATQEKQRQDSINAGGQKPKEPKSKGLLGAIEKAANKDTEAKQSAMAQVDIARIINNYNADYEQRTPGKIKYYFSPPPSWQSLPKRTKSQDEIKAENKAKLENLFEGRSAVVSPEMASAKDNQPVKKETFLSKLERIKSDGNKVGAVIYVKPAAMPKPSASTGGAMMMNESMGNKSVYVEGEYFDESLATVGKDLVQELNQSLGTSDIELIEIRNIPYREVKLLGQPTRVDDWWATKYKVVFAYTLDPRLQQTVESSGGKEKYSVSINLIASLIVTEYIGNASSTKQDILTQVPNMGSFVSPAHVQEEEMKDIREMYQKAVQKLGKPMSVKMKEERSDGIEKVAKRLLK